MKIPAHLLKAMLNDLPKSGYEHGEVIRIPLLNAIPAPTDPPSEQTTKAFKSLVFQRDETLEEWILVDVD